MPSAAGRCAVRDRTGDEEADGPAPVRPPDEPVVVGVRQGYVHRLIRRDVEEERARRLNDRGPPRGAPAARPAPFGPRKPTLECPTGREQDGADEERDSVGRRTYELHVAGERTDEKACRPEGKAQRHRTPESHEPHPCSHGGSGFDTRTECVGRATTDRTRR